jgi:hypothetical protein
VNPRRCLLLVALAAACGRASAPRPAPAPASAPPAPVQPVTKPTPAPAPEAAAEEPADLKAEDREQDPRSAAVKLKLSVSPPTVATVSWGRKKMGDLKPNHMTLELERPRGSGPLELLVRAEGFLPHHVRLYTDRDDKLAVRLVRATEASRLLGYRPPQ